MDGASIEGEGELTEMGKYRQMKAILADLTIKKALISMAPTSRQNQLSEDFAN
jgi:hypothetical protein